MVNKNEFESFELTEEEASFINSPIKEGIKKEAGKKVSGTIAKKVENKVIEFKQLYEVVANIKGYSLGQLVEDNEFNNFDSLLAEGYLKKL